MTKGHNNQGGKPRVAVLSSAPNGGAGIAAFRLHTALNTSERFDADFVDATALGGLLPEGVVPRTSFTNRVMSDTHFTIEHAGPSRGWVIDMLGQYDIINSHWASMLITLRELDALSRLNKPLLLTCHDFNYFTGGCHYPAHCRNIETGCKTCPQLDLTRASMSVVRRNAEIKRTILARPNVHLLAPSHFIIDNAVRVGAIPKERGHVLRNAYSPLLDAAPRFEPGAPIRVLLIADSLGERRKNMMLALKTLARLVRASQRGEIPFTLDLHLVGEAPSEIVEFVECTGANHTFYGKISDHARLSEVMQASDLLLTCSSEDNWPNILVEAGVYGCMPVVGPGHGCEEFVKAFDFGVVAWGYAEDAFVDAIKRAITARTEGTVWRALRRIRSDHNSTLAADRFGKIADFAQDMAYEIA
ncbi:MAG: glycosyltransferase [Maricaulis sp.]|uniref:glycosyltransferase n=2 Tax=Maricaulis sp. TaxID=1486257 RepID=UPI001B18263D|nr:glycosyltransferase [Maricaulis sp.]MBO6728435.1 glycosyltransferase [Maricaulis sp.]MBO6878202.1 glycosyltransferase [Maricaulis sp.]